MQSMLRTGPNMFLKVAYEGTPEKLIGYAQSLAWSQSQGQKPIFTVDSPFAQEIAQGAGPSSIRGQVTLYMPKGSDPVRAGLVPPTTDIKKKNGEPLHTTSKYLHWRFYDRYTQEISFALNNVKVSNWSATIVAKQVVKVTLTFEGIFFESGIS